MPRCLHVSPETAARWTATVLRGLSVGKDGEALAGKARWYEFSPQDPREKAGIVAPPVTPAMGGGPADRWPASRA